MAERKYTKAEVMKALAGLTCSVEIAGAAYGVGRNSAYELVKAGKIRAIRFGGDADGKGGKIVCPTAPIRKDLDIELTPDAERGAAA